MKGNKKLLDLLQNKSINSIKGIGQARQELFNKLGIYSVFDLITYYPKDYEDRSRIKNIADLQDGELCSFEGTIVSGVSEYRPKRGMKLYRVSIADGTSKITAFWFNQPYIKNAFIIGENYIFYGKVGRKLNKLQIMNPVYERVQNKELQKSLQILPIYPLTKDLTQNIIRASIKEALRVYGAKQEEIFTPEVKEKYNLSSITFCMNEIHFPSSFDDMVKARYRLVFEELFMLQLGLLSLKSIINESKEGIAFGTVSEMREFIDNLPFKLTGAQQRVFDEVQRDMESNKPMNRLIQGDVGSGKTIVAVLALFKAVRCGFQGAMMVPTEILAEQHFRSVAPLLESYGIKVSLLTGSQPKKQKLDIIEGLINGTVDIVIGTHALIEDKIQFNKLGLVITDEQHRFGVRHRKTLAQKGNNPDVLVMTATPIPRTLALILYGDLDISIIDELPPGRQPVKTYAVQDGMRQRINKFIREKVAEGRQVYIVCPLVEESEEIEAKSAVVTGEEARASDFKDLRVGVIHGKMKSSEKDTIMKSFAAGELDILVSTTIIEVGVNVPNATVMVIENAERFGLAQLHQLRGRVGRGDKQSFCILFNQSKSEVSRERMKIMQNSNDGFLISEKDLEIRGPGEFFGTRQHGLPNLKIANLYRDMEILILAQNCAKEVIQLDPGLTGESNSRLRNYIDNYFRGSELFI